MRHELYKCRICGKILTEALDNDRKPRKFSNWLFDNFFNETGDRIHYEDHTGREYTHTLLHRCNKKTIGVCDFIGIKRD